MHRPRPLSLSLLLRSLSPTPVASLSPLLPLHSRGLAYRSNRRRRGRRPPPPRANAAASPGFSLANPFSRDWSPIKVEAAQSAEACDAWAARHLPGPGEGTAVLGFDAEWVSHHGKVSLLQFATEDACLLVQLGCLGNGPWPASLLRMLSDRSLLKVGVGVAGDARRLALSYATTFAGFHDAGLLANRHFGRTRGAGDVQRNPMGLANLSKRMCGVSLPKNSRIRCSNWAKRKLSRTQMEYAALDAVAGREVFLRLAEEGALPCKEDQLYAWVDELLLGNEEEDTETALVTEMGSSGSSANSASGSGAIGANGSGANRAKDSANSFNDSGVSSVNGSSAGANGSGARSVNGSNVAGMNGQLLTNGANRVNNTNDLGDGGGIDRIVDVGGIADAGLGWEGRSGATSEKKASLLAMESDDIMLHYLCLKRRRHRLSAAADAVIANAAVADATVADATTADRQCDRGEAQDEAALNEDGAWEDAEDGACEGFMNGFVAEVGAPLRTSTTMEWVEHVGDELGLTVSRSVWVEESKVSKVSKVGEVGEAPHAAPHLFVAQVGIRGTGTIAEERASTMARAQEMAALKAAQYLLLNAKRSSCVSGFGTGGDFESRMGSEEWWHAPFGFDSSRGSVGGVGGDSVNGVDGADAVDVLSPLVENGQLDIDVWTSASDTGGGTRDGTRGGDTLQERPPGAQGDGTTSSSPSFPSSSSSSSLSSLSLWQGPTHHAEVRLGGRTVGSASWCDGEGAEAAAMARAVETLRGERLVYGYQKGVARGGAAGGSEESGGAGGAGQVHGGRVVGEGGARQRQVLEWFEQ